MARTQNGAKRTIDFDAVIGEVEKTPVELKFRGSTFTLPPEMPLAFMAYLADGEALKAVQSLFGEQTDAFFALNPPLEALERLADLYEVDAGEAEASSSS